MSSGLILIEESDIKGTAIAECKKRIVDENGFSTPYGDFTGLKPYDFQLGGVTYPIVFDKRKGCISYMDNDWKGLVVEMIKIVRIKYFQDCEMKREDLKKDIRTVLQKIDRINGVDEHVISRVIEEFFQKGFEGRLLKIKLGKREGTICFSYNTNNFGAVVLNPDSTGWKTDVWPIQGTDLLFADTKFRANMLVEMCNRIVDAFGYSDFKMRTTEWEGFHR